MSCPACYTLLPRARNLQEDMAEGATGFSEWLTQAMNRRGLTKQSALAIASGVAQSTIRSYLSGSRTPEKPEQVEKLVRALLLPEAENHTATALLNSGLLAAGLAPVADAEADHEVIDYLRGQPEAVQDKALRMLKAAFDEEDAKDNAGNIGRKAE